MNRQQTSTPCSTSTPNDDRWPRFLVVEAADDNHKPLTQRSDIFALNKAIEGMGGPYISVKPMNNGKQLLVHFGKKIYSDKLLYRTKELNDIPVKVTPHRTLNYSRCVIWCKELANMDEEDIQKELKSQGVTKVERMKRRKDGRLIPADSYILTVNGQEIPKEIKIGFLIRGTKVYIPNPQRCFNCQKYGHNKKFCKNEQKCAKCGQTGHEDQDCENEIKCANCDGDHPAYIRNRPKWKTEKEILKRKFQNNISFHEARQQVEGPATDPSKNSYATVTKPHQWPNSIKNPNIFKSEEEWLTHTIDSLLKRLDEIKNQKSNQNKAPCTSSASPSNEITLPVSTQITPEQRNESTISNSRSALPPTTQLDASAASDDENEMESINTTSKRGHHDSSDEEPNSPVSKKPASGSLASGRDGTTVPTGAGRGDPPKISTFCSNPPRPGGQGSSGGERSPIRPPDKQKHKAQTKPLKQSKSKVTTNTHL